MKRTLVALLILTGLAAAQTARKPGPRKQRRLPQLMELPTYPVLETAKPIRVDGSLHEWPSSLPAMILEDLRQLSGTANRSFRGPSDLRATGGMLWDQEALYLWFVIHDDWARPLHKKKNRPTRLLLPPGDSIVLYFDPKRDTRTYGPDPGRDEDREYWIGMTNDGGTLCVSCKRRHAIATLETKAQARVLFNREKRAFTAEIAIPWSELLGDAKPKRGDALDVQVVMNDFDDPTDPLPQTRIGWTFGTSPKIDPAIYGTILLAGSKWESKDPPPRPELPSAGRRVPDAKFWFQLLQSLSNQPVQAGKPKKTLRGLLDGLETRLVAYPLVDHQELMVLMQREMPRELAGYIGAGPPLFFDLVMRSILRDLQTKHDGPPKITALPGRGWLVRSKSGNVAISPACLHGQQLAKSLDALLYANCWDPLDRHDPLMKRTLARKKPVFCHLSFHLPGWGPLRKENLVRPGFEKLVGKDIQVRVLGKVDPKGRVTPMIGFQLTWPDGFTIVHPSLSALPDQVKLADGKKSVDVMILDPDHQAADRLVKELAPRIVILEGFLDAPRWDARDFPRNHRLDELDAAIERFEKLGAKVVLLPPGRTWIN